MKVGSETIANDPSFGTLLADIGELTKFRIGFLVLVTTAVAWFWTASGPFDPAILLATMFGTALCAAGANTLNQLLERDVDALMERTRNRPLPTGRWSPIEAFAFGAGLTLIGVALLAYAVNTLTALLGLFSVLSYVLVYTPSKLRTPHSTLIGAVPGALPVVMGVTAATGAIDVRAIVLFSILALWQLPHFYAIAWLYREDYARGGFPMLPVIDTDGRKTAAASLLALAALIPVTLSPTLLGFAGWTYFVAAAVLGALYAMTVVRFAKTRSTHDARFSFFASIVYLPLVLTLLVFDRLQT
jgi:protoheme IX farnesyltransferase